MYNKNNPNYMLYLSGLITENQYYDILEGKVNENYFEDKSKSDHLKEVIDIMKWQFKVKDKIDAGIDVDEKLERYAELNKDLKDALYKYITTREDYDTVKIKDKFNDGDYKKMRLDAINYVNLHNQVSWKAQEFKGWTQFWKIETIPKDTQFQSHKWFWTIEPNSHKSFIDSVKFLPSEFDKTTKLKDVYFSFKIANDEDVAKSHRDTLVLHYKDQNAGPDIKRVVDNFIAKLKIVPVDRKKAFSGMASDEGVDVHGSSETELICSQVIKQIEYNQEVMKSLSDGEITNTINHLIKNAYDKSRHRKPLPQGTSITDMAQKIKDPRWNMMYKQWVKGDKKDMELARKLAFSGVNHDMKHLGFNSKK